MGLRKTTTSTRISGTACPPLEPSPAHPNHQPYTPPKNAPVENPLGLAPRYRLGGLKFRPSPGREGLLRVKLPEPRVGGLQGGTLRWWRGLGDGSDGQWESCLWTYQGSSTGSGGLTVSLSGSGELGAEERREALLWGPTSTPRLGHAGLDQVFERAASVWAARWPSLSSTMYRGSSRLARYWNPPTSPSS